MIRIRFLWLRSFYPGISVRIEHSEKGSQLLAIELNGDGGYEPGAIARRIEKELPPDQWGALQRKLAEAGFWQLPGRDPHIPGDDGAEWLIEVAQHDQYHVVQSWAGGEIEPVGRFLIEMSGLDPRPIF
jgi:hypothetical protein